MLIFITAVAVLLSAIEGSSIRRKLWSNIAGVSDLVGFNTSRARAIIPNYVLSEGDQYGKFFLV